MGPVVQICPRPTPRFEADVQALSSLDVSLPLCWPRGHIYSV